MTATRSLPASATRTVSLSSSLKAACSAPLEPVYDGPHGATFVEAAWRLPETITQRLKDEASRALVTANQALQPADRKTVERWLATLGTLVAGTMSAQDAQLRIKSYARLLEHPASCYTDETLRAAGETFRWFPSFAEVSAFLDERAQPLRTLRDRLKAIAEAPVTRKPEEPVRKYRDLSPEEQRRHDELMASFRRARAEQPPPAPQPKPTHAGEAARRMHERMQQLAADWRRANGFEPQPQREAV